MVSQTQFDSTDKDQIWLNFPRIPQSLTWKGLHKADPTGCSPSAPLNSGMVLNLEESVLMPQAWEAMLPILRRSALRELDVKAVQESNLEK